MAMADLALSPAYVPAAWQNFAVAEVGASAALAGLLVVACSINLDHIIRIPSVVSRLGTTLTLFTSVLMIGTVMLVPRQGIRLIGVEIIVLGLATTVVASRRAAVRNVEADYRRATVAAYAVGILAAGVIVFTGLACVLAALGGLYWLVPGVMLAFGVGLLNAWVALVEILR